jgi:hypothetical protein
MLAGMEASWHGKANLGYRPSKKAIRRAVETIHALTDRAGTWQDTAWVVGKLNRVLRGCAPRFFAAHALRFARNQLWVSVGGRPDVSFEAKLCGISPDRGRRK